MMQKRIVVTGVSAITCIGLSAEEFWEALLVGETGASPVEGLPFRIPGHSVACQIKQFSPGHELQGYDRACQLAICAIATAIKDAGLSQRDWKLAPVIIGTTMSGFYAGQLETELAFSSRDHPLERPKQSLRASSDRCSKLSDVVAAHFGIEGLAVTVPTACAAGNYAVAVGARIIESEASEYAICGAADAFSPIAFAGFSKLRAMATERCRPFDKDRDGLLVSEGSAFLILESLSSAQRRNAQIYAELIGYGMSCDGHHITSPHPTGYGAGLAMERALQKAGVEAADIDYICAHGTGTLANDRMESKAMEAVFGEQSHHIPVSSIKSSIGHAMGAASAIEAVACIFALRDGVIPPTQHCQHPDPDCQINIVCGSPRAQPITTVMSNAFAFGGNNATILLRTVD